jgi:1,4-dihydroxy-2-naphthoyl-CoA hydrolase
MIKAEVNLQDLNAMNKGNMGEHLDIIYTAIGEDFLEGSMPVDHRTTQPFGLLHGGASVVLAETLGSLAANLCVGPDKYCVGLDINANHIKAVRSGRVNGRAQLLHLGGKTQVWEIKIHNEGGGLVCVSRITMVVLEKKAKTKT